MGSGLPGNTVSHKSLPSILELLGSIPSSSDLLSSPMAPSQGWEDTEWARDWKQPALARHTSQGNGDPTRSNYPEWACQCPVGGNRSWEQREGRGRKWGCPQLLPHSSSATPEVRQSAQPLPGSTGAWYGVGPIAWLPSGPSLRGHLPARNGPPPAWGQAPSSLRSTAALGSAIADGNLLPGADGGEEAHLKPGTVLRHRADSAGLGDSRDDRATLHRHHSVCTAGAAGEK